MPEEKEVDLWLAIGRFTSEFSQLEFTFKHYLAEIIGLPGRHFDAVMSGYDFASLCRITGDVFSRELGDTETAALAAVIKRCMNLNEDRVRIMHGLWVTAGENRGVHHVSRQTLRSRKDFNSAGDLKSKADLANKLRGELTRIILGLSAFPSED